jgi:hypothetical protein
MPRDLAGLAGLGALGYMLANRNKGADRDTDTGMDVMPSYAQQTTPSMIADNGEVRDETGALSRFRRNTETGDLYSPDEPITSQPMSRKPSSDLGMRTMEYRVKDKADADAMKKELSGANSGVTRMSKEAGEAAQNKFRESSKPEVTKPPTSPKKETYRDLSGNIKTKKSAAERDAEMAERRESALSGIKSIGSSIGDMASKARQNYESTRPVSRQVQRERDQAMSRGNLRVGGAVKKMASGGMTSSASKRADGIATKGKTRGKIC